MSSLDACANPALTSPLYLHQLRLVVRTGIGVAPPKRSAVYALVQPCCRSETEEINMGSRALCNLSPPAPMLNHPPPQRSKRTRSSPSGHRDVVSFCSVRGRLRRGTGLIGYERGAQAMVPGGCWFLADYDGVEIRLTFDGRWRGDRRCACGRRTQIRLCTGAGGVHGLCAQRQGG